MISADVSKLEIQCKKRLYIFHLILLGILYFLLRAEGGGGGGLLSGQNLLNTAKAICRQSLKA